MTLFIDPVSRNVGVTNVGVCGTGALHGTLGLGASCDVVHELCASEPRPTR